MAMLSLCLTILCAILLAMDVSGARDYGLDVWSPDIIVTNTTDSNSLHKNMLQMTELSEGQFNFLYEIGPTKPKYFTFTETDKLGGLVVQGPATTLPGWVENMAFGVTQRIWTYHYDEERATLNFVAMQDHSVIGFFTYSKDGRLLLHKTLEISDMNLELDPRYVHLYQRIEGCEDSLGRTHVIIATLAAQKDNSDYGRLRFIHILVTWHPFKIGYRSVWQSPEVDTEPWWQAPYMDHVPWPLITIGPSDEIVILHPIMDGLTLYRAFTIGDVTGNWTTHKICETDNPDIGLFLPSSEVFVDERSRIHATWFDIRQSSLVYACMDEAGNKLVEPWAFAMLGQNVFNVAIRTSTAVVDEGETLIAFNIVPYVSYSYWTPPAPYQINGEIRLVVLRNPDPDRRDYSIIKMVRIPTVSECYLHLDDAENVYLFWFDQRTGTTQLYMKYLAHPGISLDIDFHDWANAQTIRPGQTKVIPLRLRNVGSVEIESVISLETNASPDWDLQLTEYRARLEPFGSLPFNLTVYCPPSAMFGESVETWVNATTSDRDYASRVRLLMFVMWDRELAVSCRPTFHLTEPGMTTTYRVVLQNNGDLNETVQVAMVGAGPPGWSLGPGDLTYWMGVRNVRSFDVSVKSPEGAFADEAYTAMVYFTWGDGIQAAPTLVLRTVVRPTFFVTMEANRTRVMLHPGEIALFGLRVGNEGNLPGKAYIEVTTLTDPGEWRVILSKETVVLDPCTSEDLELLLGAPVDAQGGAIMVVRVRAYCPNPFSEVVLDLRAEVEHILSLSTDAQELTLDIAPMSSGSGGLNITNRGNLFEVVAFRLDGLGPEWSWWVRAGGVEARSISVGPGETGAIDVWVHVPAGAKAGRHALRLYLEAEGLTVGHVDLTVRVAQVRELTLASSPLRGVAYPGGHVEIAVTVGNAGNGEELVELSVYAPGLALPQFLSDDERVSAVWLPPRTARTIVLWARVDDYATIGTTEVWTTATSMDDARTVARSSTTFEVVAPTVGVCGVVLDPARPRANDIVTVRVMLLNSGPVEVTDVTITMTGAEPELLASIRPGGEASATFVWVASGYGDVNLEGAVDFEPGNRTVTWSTTVNMGGVEAGSSYIPVLMAAAMAATIAVIVAMIVKIRGTRARAFPTKQVEKG